MRERERIRKKNDREIRIDKEFRERVRERKRERRREQNEREYERE